MDRVRSGSLPDLVKIAPRAADVVTIADFTTQEHGARASAGTDLAGYRMPPAQVEVFSEA